MALSLPKTPLSVSMSPLLSSLAQAGNTAVVKTLLSVEKGKIDIEQRSSVRTSRLPGLPSHKGNGLNTKNRLKATGDISRFAKATRDKSWDHASQLFLTKQLPRKSPTQSVLALFWLCCG